MPSHVFFFSQKWSETAQKYLISWTSMNQPLKLNEQIPPDMPELVQTTWSDKKKTIKTTESQKIKIYQNLANQ